MNGVKQIWSPGYPVTDEALQRMADQAAKGGDEELRHLVVAEKFTNGSLATGNVVPLARPASGTRFCVTSADGYVETAAPAIVFKTATGGVYVAGVSPYPNISAEQVATNDSGVTRNDLVYLMLARQAVHQTRKIKDPSTGAVSTQSVPWYSDLEVTLHIRTGSISTPADTSTAWHVPIATLAVPHGYNQGDWVTDSMVTQTWSRGSLNTGLQRPYDLAKPDTPPSDLALVGAYTGGRNPGRIRIAVPVKINEGASDADPNSRAIEIDTLHDWRRRIVEARVVRAMTGQGPFYEATTGDFGVRGLPAFTGYTTGSPMPFDLMSLHDRSFLFTVTSTGALRVSISLTPGFAVPAGGEYYWIEVEGSHQLVEE
jgi:hypothetical protein